MVAYPQDSTSPGANLALFATASTSYVSGHETLAAVNDGFAPAHSNDKSHGAYGNWPRTGTQWVQYDWEKPISTTRIEVYWFDDNRGVRLPAKCRLLYWNGKEFLPVPDAVGLGCEANKFNITVFPEITTTKLRLEFDGREKFSTGILEWRVIDSGKSPYFPPRVKAGVDRAVIVNGKTYLDGIIIADPKYTNNLKILWRKKSGSGKVVFEDPKSPSTTASFSTPGNYILELTADDGIGKASDTIEVNVEQTPPSEPLQWVYPVKYEILSPFWKTRIKKVIQNWIPHCIAKIEDPNLREGGIENFVQAKKKLSGESARHTGLVFSDAWTYNTFESMCLALMVDPQGDSELKNAQQQIRQKVEEWLPKILGAQEPDGYIHTMYTIRGLKRWSNKHDHEDYLAGYFIDAALAHYLSTDCKDTRFYNAAKKLADCWIANIAQPKRKWYSGHQGFEQTLVKFGKFINEREGTGKGDKYIQLAKYLMDCRGNGEEYDQSHLPVIRQYEAVGHAVRAMYSYSAMAGIAGETGNIDYHSAVKSLWNNFVNKKYYITGGAGSGETSEGFGKNFSLPNRSYCESCAGCGSVFFQHNMLISLQKAIYADVMEETLYNNVLGALDIDAQNFTYTNPLDSAEKRYKWHGCPCCVGNISRTLLMLPSWSYAIGKNTLFVNQYTGCKTTLKVGDQPVEIAQLTDYPWQGKVTIFINPEKPTKFTINLRAPDRQTSLLYTNTPQARGIVALSVNGKTVKPKITDGYASLNRIWSKGDKIEIEFPMPIQRVKCDWRVAANIGRVALRRGPLVYNVESVDQNIERVLQPQSQLSTEWRPDLLDGIMVIRGVWDDGSPLIAIPNYARLNRGGRSIVWVKDK